MSEKQAQKVVARTPEEATRLRRKAFQPDYASQIELHLNPWFGGFRIDDITTAEVEAYVRAKAAALGEAGGSPADHRAPRRRR